MNKHLYPEIMSVLILVTLIISGCCSKNPTITLSGLNYSNFDTVINGENVSLYTLSNGDMEVCITNYGGRIVSLMVPDRDGSLRDVVLGHDNIRDYINIDGNFGAIIGRYGNRINQGRFMIDSMEYQLPQNNYGHCLHGGQKGFHHSVWNASQTSDSTLVLNLHSPDGDAGFPGNLDVVVTYSLTSNNSLEIDYKATTDKPTIVNLTNHSYFNLSGDPMCSILDEIVTIQASSYIPIDSTFIPIGNLVKINGTPFDYSTGRTIADTLGDETEEQLRNGHGIDHNFVLDNDGSAIATVHDPYSGIVMSIITDQPGIQFYTGNFLDGTIRGKKGFYYAKRSALCLETQHYPDSPNHKEWPSTLLNPNERYHTKTIYSFSAK